MKNKWGVSINSNIRIVYLKNEPGSEPEYVYAESLIEAKAAAYDAIAENCALFAQISVIQLKSNDILSIEIFNKDNNEWETYSGK